MAILGYAAGETEALFDKAESACHEAKEEADRPFFAAFFSFFEASGDAESGRFLF